MTTRFSLPPLPPGHGPAGDADVVAFLQQSLIRPVDETRATRDIETLAAVARATANVTAFTPRRERAFQRVAVAAAVVVVASGAGFVLAQFGGGPQGQSESDMLAVQSPQDVSDTATPLPSETENATDAPGVVNDDTSGQAADTPPTSTPSTPQTSSPSTPDSETDASISEPAPRQEAPVGDAGDAQTIDTFASDDSSETCDGEDADAVACSPSEDEPAPADETDPRDLLRQSRFGTN